MFKKILVPVDGSEGSWRALAQAVAIGEKFESEIQVVNVIQPYNNAALLAVPLDHGTVKQGNSELEKIGDKVLEMAQEKMAGYPHNVVYSIEVGHPSERIIAFTKKEECDAIVLGSRGFGMLEGLFKNSVSQVIVEQADVPVIVVK